MSDKLNTSVRNLTQEEIDKLKEDDSNRVYEYAYEKPEIIMSANEQAFAFDEIRKRYLLHRKLTPDLSDDECRELIKTKGSELVNKFCTACNMLWHRITDRTVNENMINHYKFMIVMRGKVESGDVSSDGATDIVREATNNMTIREATEDEIRTGTVKTKMWEGNPLTGDKSVNDACNSSCKYVERDGVKIARVAENPETVILDPSKMRKLERVDINAVTRKNVQNVLREIQTANTRFLLVNSMKKLSNLMARTPHGTEIDINGLDAMFRMKKCKASAAWDREVSSIAERILRLAHERTRKETKKPPGGVNETKTGN